MSNFGRASNVARNVYVGTQWNIAGTGVDRTSTVGEITDEQKHVCLQSLAFPEMRERGNDIANAASNTCTWLSRDPRYLEWSNQRHGLLWIKGHPGVGKSTLMKHAAEGLRSRRDAIFASFFFYGGGVLIQKNTLGLFRSLLHQIIQQVPSLLLELTHTFTKRCETDGEYGGKWTWHERELQNFFQSAVVEAAKTNTTCIFVDALDECGEQTATTLVSFFESIANYLSICFSCRHYPLIALENGLEICVEDKNAEDIATFVCQKLNGEDYDPIRDQIIQRSAGNFQWANLVVSLVLNLVTRGNPLRAIQRKIQHIPRELSKLYEELINSIPDDDIQESLRLMQWIYFGLRPLSLTELRFAMAVDANPSSTSISQCQETEHYVETDEAMERRVRDLSKGLAEPVKHRYNRVAQFIHKSVIEFFDKGGLQLLDRSQRGVTSDSFAGRSHFRMSHTCIRYLAMDETQQQFGQISGERFSSKYSLRFPLLEYSGEFWIGHAAKCEENNLSASQLLSYGDSAGILDKYFEDWRHYWYWSYYDFKWPITMLHIASRHNLQFALEDLISQGVKADPRDGDGRTPLSWAVQNGHETVVRMLLDRVDVNPDSTAKNGRTPLSWAVEHGYEAIVRMLMDRNDVNLDSTDQYGRTPLIYAIGEGFENIVKLLLERDDFRRSPTYKSDQKALFYAIHKGYEGIVGLLLERGDVKVNTKDEQGRTPLFFAIDYRHQGIVKMLLKRDDIEVNLKDKWGRMPLFWAIQYESKGIVGLLLERDDMEVNPKDEQGRTPLFWAIRHGSEGIVGLLLERNDVDVNSKDKWGRTPLSYAAEDGKEGIAELLLQKDNVEVNLKDNRGRTPLSYAAEDGKEGIVELLLQKDNVEVNPKDYWGRTPLSYAAEFGYVEIIRLLSERAIVEMNSSDIL